MRVLHVCTDEIDLKNLHWTTSVNVKSRVIKTLEDSYRYAGMLFDMIIFDDGVDEKVRQFLLSTLRSVQPPEFNAGVA